MIANGFVNILYSWLPHVNLNKTRDVGPCLCEADETSQGLGIFNLLQIIKPIEDSSNGPGKRLPTGCHLVLP
jgi:hypothetical protein